MTASRGDRGSVFPVFVVALGTAVFIGLYISIHAVWPTVKSVAQDATTNQYALDMIGYADTFIDVLLPFAYLVLLFLYWNIRANRDAGGGL